MFFFESVKSVSIGAEVLGEMRSVFKQQADYGSGVAEFGNQVRV